MEFTINLIDLFWILVGVGCIVYLYSNNTVTKGQLKAIERRIETIEQGIIKPEVLIDSINRLLADVTTINLNQNVHSSSDTLVKYKINDELTNALLVEGRMNIEELKNMALMLGINGKSGIDYTTQSSAARGILNFMSQRKRMLEMAEYIKQTRPDIFSQEENLL